jgi:hypothetical protein
MGTVQEAVVAMPGELNKNGVLFCAGSESRGYWTRKARGMEPERNRGQAALLIGGGICDAFEIGGILSGGEGATGAPAPEDCGALGSKYPRNCRARERGRGWDGCG